MDTINLILLFLEEKRNIFINGVGGTGKSFILRRISSILRDKIIFLTAPTGIAALNINGTTIHRFAGIGTGEGTKEALLKRVVNSFFSKGNWKDAEILIIDEISMMGGELFEKLDFIAQNIRGNNLPFGGILLIVCGDFLQLPPVKDYWCFKTETWKKLNFIPITLTEPKRYDDLNYFDFLNRIRIGSFTPDDLAKVQEKVKEFQKLDIDQMEIQPTILYSKKIDVLEYNLKKLKELNQPIIDFISYDYALPASNKEKKQTMQNMHSIINLQDYSPILEEIIPKTIQLCKGAQVMLKKNLDVKNGLVNGSRGVITELTKDGVTVKFLNEQEVQLKPETWEMNDNKAIVTRTQIPLILAWALTCHKSQGSTLDSAICDLGTSLFCSGQAYVALSRVRNWKSLYVSSFYPKRIMIDEEAKSFLKIIENIKIKIVYDLEFEKFSDLEK